MEKIVYLLGRPADLAVDEWRKRLLDGVLAEFPARGTRGLQASFADVEADVGASVPVRSGEPPPEGLVSLWLECHDLRTPFEDALRRASSRLSAYLVTESVPRAYDVRDWSDGERTPGVKLLTLFDRPARLTDERFYQIWYGEHTPLSFEIHPLWGYFRNAVARVLTPGARSWRGIVEEQFRTREDLTDPRRFYGGEALMKANMKRVLDHCRSFLDLEEIQTVVMSEYILQTRH
jgi:hypothetical protein